MHGINQLEDDYVHDGRIYVADLDEEDIKQTFVAVYDDVQRYKGTPAIEKSHNSYNVVGSREREEIIGVAGIVRDPVYSLSINLRASNRWYIGDIRGNTHILKRVVRHPLLNRQL